jgi:hypothetical protein
MAHLLGGQYGHSPMSDNDQQWKKLFSELNALGLALGLTVVLLALACFLLWKILQELQL